MIILEDVLIVSCDQPNALEMSSLKAGRVSLF